jgi:alkanesulfonate monooxygenase SsuD/methylene tetrahydromethanopterin reductase-like flavin-dependent oxidoreductase (luciferase family)
MVHEIGIAPRPYQDPHPPLYGAFAHSMRTIDMWAREGGKPIVMANQMDFCQALWTRYMTKAAEAGREMTRENAAAWGGVLMLGDNPTRLAEIKDDHDWYWHTFQGQDPVAAESDPQGYCRDHRDGQEQCGDQLPPGGGVRNPDARKAFRRSRR